MKTVNIANLKANLSKYLRDVRRGNQLVVMDRDTPVARVVPYAEAGEPLVIRHPLRRYESIQQVPIPPPAEVKIDAVSLLLEERQAEI